MPKVKENTSECVKKAKIFLKVYEKDCWNNHRGIYKATMDCLRKGSDHAEKFKKECGTEIEYYPRLPEKKNFCVNTANKNIKKFLETCEKSKKTKNDCEKEVMEIAKKWEKSCDADLKFDKDKLPFIQPKNQAELKEEVNKQNVNKIVDKKIVNLMKKDKIQGENVNKIKKFLKKEINSELKISHLKNKEDVSKVITQVISKKNIQQKLIKSSMKKEIKSERLDEKIDEILNTNPQDLLIPEPTYTHLKISTEESTDPEFLKELSTFETTQKS